MLIGQLAESLGVPPETIRFYERRGLIAAPPRAANGYRLYDESTLSRLRFIRAAQAAGLTLAEIRGVIEIRDDGARPCTHVADLLGSKLAEVRERRRELAALERDLVSLVRLSGELDPADCSDSDVCNIVNHPRPTGAVAQTANSARSRS